MKASTTPPARQAILATAIAITVGALVPIQSRVNGELATRAGDGYFAALSSFGTGLVLLTVLVVTTQGGRDGVHRMRSAITTRQAPWWYFIGGLCGAGLVLAQSLTVAIIGVALFTVSIIAGQTIAGAWIDRRGLGTMPGRPLGPTRIVGAGLMLVAVLIAVGGDIAGSGSLLWLGMPLLAGLGTGFQQAVNGQVGALTKSVLVATWNNFLVGFAGLLVAFGVHGIVAGFPRTVPSLIDSPWLYVGGVIGCCFIAAGVALVRRTGVLLFSLGTIAGQLLGSLLLDVIVPPAGHVLRWTTVAGTVLALIAVGISSIRRPATTQPAAK